MEVIIYIIAYLVGVLITYAAHYYYSAYIYSKSQQIQSKYYFAEYAKESSLMRSLVSCFWLFVVPLLPIALVIGYSVELIQNAIKKHFNIEL